MIDGPDTFLDQQRGRSKFNTLKQEDYDWLCSVAGNITAQWEHRIHDPDELLWAGYCGMRSARKRLKKGTNPRGRFVWMSTWGRMWDYARCAWTREVHRKRAEAEVRRRGWVSREPRGTSDVVERLLQLVPPHKREIVRMHAVYGMTFEEMGKELGVGDGMALLLYQAELKFLRGRVTAFQDEFADAYLGGPIKAKKPKKPKKRRAGTGLRFTWEVAEDLGVHAARIRYLIATGRVKEPARLEGRRVFDDSSVDRLQEALGSDHRYTRRRKT